ncbi:MAG: hypothetical protein SPJ28_03425 [Oscillospiraceae bacterium]|nr:hypothetical protein [Oscillospiraceae bacterium]
MRKKVRQDTGERIWQSVPAPHSGKGQRLRAARRSNAPRCCRKAVLDIFLLSPLLFPPQLLYNLNDTSAPESAAALSFHQTTSGGTHHE